MPAKLVLIGDGPERGNVEYLIRQKSLTKDVFLLGKQDDVYEKLGLADLFLLPSDLESFGLAALEAMACEVPVVATNVGGVPDVVEHGVDGYLVTPRDVVSAGTLRHRNPFARRPRPRNGPAGSRRRQEKILRQRRNPALRSLLPQRARERRRRARLTVASHSDERSVTSEKTSPGDSPQLVRGMGLGSAVALNMLDMIGVGPFITCRWWSSPCTVRKRCSAGFSARLLRCATAWCAPNWARPCPGPADPTNI